MDLSHWFHQQLQTSTEGFLWAVEQIPPERLYLEPRPGKWPVARLLFHMASYDRAIGLPALRQWVGEPFSMNGLTGSAEGDAALEEANWKHGEGQEMQAMIAEFKKLRAEQLSLLQHFPEHAWREEREALWGPRPLTWVVAKTYQHTLEHTDEILRAYLWWK